MYIHILLYAVEKVFPDLIKLLPTNCSYTVRILQRNQNFSKIGSKFEELSLKSDDSYTIYLHLLPYIYRKCGYNVLEFIDMLETALKTTNQKKQLREFGNGKKYIWPVKHITYICIIQEC